MNIAPTSAATNRSGWNTWRKPASAVPTSTGAIAAGNVRTRAAINQMRTPLGLVTDRVAAITSRPAWELREVGPALLEVGVAPLLRLLAHVEEQVRVVGKLLDARQTVLVGVEARLEHPQRERGHRQHLPAPLDGLLLELIERHHGVDQPHRERLLGDVLPAQEPDLLGLLGPDEAGEHRRTEAAVERPDPWPGLAEAGVVGGGGQVADGLETVAAADRVTGDHRHDRLG